MRRFLLIIFTMILFVCCTSCKGSDQETTSAFQKEESPLTIDRILALEDRSGVLIALTDYLGEKCGYGDHISALSEAERVVYVTQWLEMEVNNGGFSQYFFNSAGNFANDLVSSYEKIGAVNTAEICKEALSVFEGKVPEDRIQRHDAMLSMDEDVLDTIFRCCDDAFLAYNEDLESLTYAYVLEHREQFT